MTDGPPTAPSSRPLTDNISYYFYMIFAEKGANTEVIVEDAWFSYDDLFNSGVGLQLGQGSVDIADQASGAPTAGFRGQPEALAIANLGKKVRDGPVR